MPQKLGPNETAVPGAKYPAIKQITLPEVGDKLREGLINLITQMTPAYDPNNLDARVMKAKREAVQSQMRQGQNEPYKSLMQQLFGVTTDQWMKGIYDNFANPVKK